MTDGHVKTVLDHMSAAQVVLAVYGSPDGPTDAAACYEALAMLLESPSLLKAQIALVSPGKFITILGEPNPSSFVVQ